MTTHDARAAAEQALRAAGFELQYITHGEHVDFQQWKRTKADDYTDYISVELEIDQFDAALSSKIKDLPTLLSAVSLDDVRLAIISEVACLRTQTALAMQGSRDILQFLDYVLERLKGSGGR